MDIKKMLTDALESQERMSLEQKIIERTLDLGVEVDEFHAKQLAWSLPLIAAAEELRTELEIYENFKIETDEVSVSLTIRPDSDDYIDDLEYVVRTELPSHLSPGKLFLCEEFTPADTETGVKVIHKDSVEEAVAWLVEKAAKGIKGNL